MALVVLKVFFLIHLVIGMSEAHGQLRVGFYSETCPQAESIVRTVVQDAIHLAGSPECIHFTKGCDGSILIQNGLNAERNSLGHADVGGFEVIAKAKQELETVCKGVVSCADIVVLAARDALFFKNVPFYEVPTGRRDGRVSNMSHAADMPEPDDSVELLKSKFMPKGLSHEDLVLLISAGAHTIGTVVCGVMQKRLYNFSMDSTFDPAIKPHFLPKLKAMCPRGDFNNRIPLDAVTNSTFDDQSLRNIQDGFSVLTSDARVKDDIRTNRIIRSYIQPSLTRPVAHLLCQILPQQW